MLSGKLDDQIAMNQCVCTRCQDHPTPAARGARKICDIALDFSGITHVDGACFYPLGLRRSLDNRELSNPCGSSGISKDCDSRDIRANLFKQLQPFRADAVFDLREACGVTARP